MTQKRPNSIFSFRVLYVLIFILLTYALYSYYYSYTNGNYLLGIVLIFGAILVLYAHYVLAKTFATNRWFQTDGKVVSSSIEQHIDFTSESKINYFYPKITYIYHVDDKAYQSESISIDIDSIMNTEKDIATELLNKIKEDDNIKVYYNPLSPNNSVLLQGLSKKRYHHYLTLYLSGLILIVVEMLLRIYFT